VKRYPAFDPPEYVQWEAEASVMEEFAATVEGPAARQEHLSDLPIATLVALYEGLLRFRLHDIALKRWVRQGVISKAWLGTGEEAVTVGNVHALQEGDVIGPMIRNAGAYHEMGMPVADLFRAYLGTADQITRGRDFHTGDAGRGVLPPISFVGSLVPVMAGMALAFRIREEKRVALTWVGDGASRTGEFHEVFNFAAVQRLPLIVVLQDNGVALGTRRNAHSRASMRDLGTAYGVEALTCDGNNVLDVYGATLEAAETCRDGGGPALIVARTFRMGGHATHDEAEARTLFPAEQFEHWGKRDPVGMYEAYLVGLSRSLGEDGENREILHHIEERVTAEVEKAAELALASRESAMPDGKSLLEGVLAGHGEDDSEPAFPPCPIGAPGTTMKG
jgi:TPP-dependent pyruvate/acetoin dehydrogenase alpha subunit